MRQSILKKIMSIVLVCLLTVYLMPLTISFKVAATAGGNWTDSGNFTAVAEGNLTITTAAQLAGLALAVNNGADFQGYTVTLANDLNLSAHYWTPIGNFDTSKGFKGTFNGGGHKISNLTIGTPVLLDTTFGYTGLFGYVEQGTITDVLLIDVAIYSSNNAGGLVGYWNGTNGTPTPVSNCFVSGNMSAMGYYAGGLIGKADYCTVSKCGTTVNMTGGNETYAGGLLGQTDSPGSATSCYATGSVNVGPSGCAGGLIGAQIETKAWNSYATGSISSGALAAGGLIGYSDNGDSSGCCYNTSTGTASGVGFGVDNTLHMTSNQMKDPSFVMFLNGGYAGTWAADTGNVNQGYPVLMVFQDTTPPTLSAASATNVTSSGTTLNFTSNEAGTYYYLIYAATDTTPNATTIRAQGTAIAKSSGEATASANSVGITGLSSSTAYKAYVIVEDAATNLSEVAAISFTTAKGNWSDTGNYTAVTEGNLTINTEAQLAGFAVAVNNGAHFQGYTVTLAKNLDLSDNYWTPIGNTNSDSGNNFRGTFNGNGHVISNLQIGTSSNPNNTLVNAGLFGYVYDGTITNVKLTNVSIYSSNANVGALVGYWNGSTGSTAEISNCGVEGSLTFTANGSWQYAGGLIGTAYTNCKVLKCYAAVNVSGDIQTIAGGLIGWAYTPNTTVTSCYATGNVSAGSDGMAGGLFGIVCAYVENCYSAGIATCSQYVGEFCAYSNGLTLGSVAGKYCYFKIASGYGVGNSVPPTPTGKTSVQMKDTAFVTLLNAFYSGTWALDSNNINQGYPILTVFPDTTAPNLGSTSATNVTSAGATLNFTSNEAGTYYYLVYAAADTAPNAATVKAQGTAVAKGSGTAAASANAVGITGLSASTAYKAYIIVEDAAGNASTVYPINITTLAPDTTVPTVSNKTITSSNVTYNSATLGWNKATDDRSAQTALQYLVYWSASNNIGTVSDIETNSTAIGTYTADIATKDITGLSAETTYYFNIIVKDESGNKTCYTAKSVTTSEAPDTTAPTVANKTIVPSDLTHNSVTIGWSKASDNKSTQTALQYQVYWSSSDNIGTVADIETNGSPIGNFAADITSKYITGLLEMTTYYFNIIVKDEAGNKSCYTTKSVTTPEAPDTTPPTVENKTIGVSNLTHNSMTLGWSKATDNKSTQTALQYHLYYSGFNNINTVEDAELNGTSLGISTDSSSANLQVLNPETTYYFNIVVWDEAGNKTCYNTLSVTTLPTPDTTVPTVENKTIGISNLTHQNVTLGWSKASDNKSAQSALQYQVYWSSSDNIGTVADIETNGSPIGNFVADITSKYITGLSEMTTYYFNIIVKDEAGNKSCYTTKSVKTPEAPDATPPTVENKTIETSNLTHESVTLGWSKASDNKSAQSALQYQVYWSSSDNIDTVADIEANGYPIGNFAADISSKNITGLSEKTTYYFNIIVKDEAGNKSSYTTQSVTTPESPDTTPPTIANKTIISLNLTHESVTLGWSKATDDRSAQTALRYSFYYSMENNINTISEIETNGFYLDYINDIDQVDISGMTANTTYYFAIIVSDEAGNKNCYTTIAITSLEAPDTTAPTVADKTIGLSNLTHQSVTLGWSKATDNKSTQSALQYLVYFSGSNNIGTVADIEANGSPIGSYAADLSSINVTGLTPETTYYFNVIVKDEAGNKTCYTTKSITTLEAPDIIAPVVANKTITLSYLTESSATLNWVKATDNKSAQTALQYLVYLSNSNNLNTVSDIEANGTPIGMYATDISAKTITGLTEKTSYYFNVVVKDQAGNKTCYTVKAVTTPAAPIGTLPIPANASQNSFSADKTSVSIGQTVTLTATGDRQNASGTTLNDERYIPVSWTSTEAGKSGTFTGGTSSYSPSAAGTYTVTASFQRQMYNGSMWININGEFDKKSITITVSSKGESNPSSQSTSSTPNSSATVTIGASDITSDKDVTFTLGNIQITAPASVCKELLGTDAASTLRMTLKQTSDTTLNLVKGSLGTGNAVIVSFELILEKVYSDGRTEQIYNFGSKLKVTINLTDAQFNAIKEQSKARLYWYDSETGKLTDMKAVFDFSAKTATFYTDHFSAFLIAEVTSSINGTDVEAPAMGETGFDISINLMIAAISVAAAIVIFINYKKRQKGS